MTIRVLLADDHRVIVDGLRSLIESQGDMSVVGVAGSGVEALRRTLETAPDVVVMDQAMPEMTGTEAAQMIRQRRERESAGMARRQAADVSAYRP